MPEEPVPEFADAEPTKEFFVAMLVRDIRLRDAIVELVDNAVDGALASGSTDHLRGRRVDVDLSRNEFRISDNCGGIPLVAAREYAFKFGRPSSVEAAQGSIGRFGVGMKRAIFRIGQDFRVESTTETDSFVVEQDVREWIKETGPWHFPLREVERPAGAENGTTITITALHEPISIQFGLDEFQNSLMTTLSERHSENLRKGLELRVNGDRVEAAEVEISSDAAFEPLRVEREYNGTGPPLHLRLIAGVAPRDRRRAGWYVFMNGREVLHADQSYATGWGDRPGVPSFHEDFAYFRGYAFLTCADPARLPWTTTKMTVDTDTEAYQAVRSEMVRTMEEVFAFLRAAAKERSEQGDEAELHEKMMRSQTVSVSELSGAGALRVPQPKPRPPTTTVQYQELRERVDRAKEELEVGSNREVGSHTFDYWFRREIGGE